MKTVHVVAWQYNTGGGFNWYHTPEAADHAFAEEKVTADQFASELWTAFRFDVRTAFTGEEITSEISAHLDELCAAAQKTGNYYPEGSTILNVESEIV